MLFAKSNKVKTTALTDALPVYAYEEGKVIFKDGRVGVGFRVNSAVMERWHQDQFNSAWVGFQAALKTQPVGCVVQKTDIYYDRPYVHPPAPNQYFTQRLGEYFSQRLVLYHDGYLFLSYAPVATNASGGVSAKKAKPPRATSSLNALINRAADKLPESLFASISTALAEAERHASDFIEAMRAVPDVSFTRLGEAEIRQVYLQFMNLEFDSHPQHYQREVLNSVGTLAVGEQKVSCISLTGQGSHVHPCVENGYKVASPMVFPLTDFLAIPHIFTQAIQIQDTKAELTNLDLDAKLNRGLSKFATQDNLIRIAEIEELSAEVRAAGKELCLLHVNVLVWETVDQMRKANIALAAAALRSLYSAEAAVESFLTLPLFMASLPGNGFQVADRWLPTTSDRATCFFHWTKSYTSTRSGEYICDRFRNLKRVNLFDVKQDNQNSITIGPSGSGKSYTMGHLIVQRYENGARQIIIDVGGSYRNVCQALTGKDFINTYFEYDPANPIEFNPFFLPRDPESQAWRYTEDKVTFHLSLLGTLWKATGSLDKSETVLLARYLKDYYAYLNAQPALGHTDEEFPGMDSFFSFVRRVHEFLVDDTLPVPAAAPVAALPAAASSADGSTLPALAPAAAPLVMSDTALMARRKQYLREVVYVEMDNFFMVVGEFASGGRYAKVLNAKRDVDLSEYPLICFDMKLVKTDPTLYPVVAMLITELSLDLFRKFPEAVKYILMDEAWSMLSGTLKDFIENMYRTIRKTRGSIGIITQGIGEILASSIGAALIGNSATKIILRHDDENARQSLQVPLGFTPQDMQLLSSMRQGTGYREFFIKQGQQGDVFALEASPQLNAILTSRAEEREYLNKLVNHYQLKRPVPVLDSRGRIKLDENGRPLYSTIMDIRLDFAVDAFVATNGIDPDLDRVRAPATENQLVQS